MLTNDLLTALKGYTAGMTRTVSLVLNNGEHSKRDELKKFLNDFASVSNKLIFEERELPALRSSISFQIEADGEPTGIVFSGIPGGHEFNSLVLAVLHADQEPQKLDEQIKQMVRAIDKPLNFETFVSLSCHNCPDVVQTLNQFAALNSNIVSETIDGGLYKSEIEARNIQGVPSVYLNGEPFANGKISTAQIIEKLLEKHPELAGAHKSTEKLPLQDSVIIGGGPAGVSAAIYLARKGLAVTIVADRFGGQIQDTMGIENLIGKSKTTGPELSADLATHMNDYEITKRELRVDRIEKGDTKKVVLLSGEEIETKTVIIATGAKWRELGIPGERENIGQGVAYCPHCDGPFFKGKDIAVVGGGNSGIEAAIDLAGIVNSVTVFEFMPELKADQVLIKQAESRDNIKILKNVVTKEIIADNGKVVGVEYQERATEDMKRADLNGVFVQIGLVPNSEFLKGIVEVSRFGEVIINERCETSEPGIYAAGDVSTVPYKQIVIAIGEGAKAALSAYDYLLRG
ncbi:MAG: alkyl hydroperoxide reductase subunit F [Reinekea sp.]